MRRAHATQRRRPPLAAWAACAALLAAAPTSAAAAKAPLVTTSIATKNGTLIGPVQVRAAQTTIKVGRARCTVAAGTPLAALIALRKRARQPSVGTLRLKDYGGCGTRPSSSARLYLTAIDRDRASGPDGWVYDVGGRSGSTGAADPAGPFAKGRLRSGAQLMWRWCRASTDPEGDCGDTLAITQATRLTQPQSTGTALHRVRVILRSGATSGSAGTTAPAPPGTVVSQIDARGRTFSTATIAASDGTARLDLDISPPRGMRLVATAGASIAPTGILWPLPS